MSDDLVHKVQAGSAVRDLFQHPGMEVMRKKIDQESGKAHSKWLLAENDEDAKRIRDAAKGYEQFFNFAKQIILQGDLAKQVLEKKQQGENQEE